MSSNNNNCSNGNCDSDGDDLSDLRLPRETNVFQILMYSFLWSLVFGLVYYGLQIQRVIYENKNINILAAFIFIYILSVLIAAFFAFTYKNKNSTCSAMRIWGSVFLTSWIIPIIYTIGLFGAYYFESDPSNEINWIGIQFKNYFSKNNLSITSNIILGYPIMLLLVWKGANNPNCI